MKYEKKPFSPLFTISHYYLQLAFVVPHNIMDGLFILIGWPLVLQTCSQAEALHWGVGRFTGRRDLGRQKSGLPSPVHRTGRVGRTGKDKEALRDCALDSMMRKPQLFLLQNPHKSSTVARYCRYK